VDLVGIEPTTSSMPWKRAPSCATGPHEKRCTRGLKQFNSRLLAIDSQTRWRLFASLVRDRFWVVAQFGRADYTRVILTDSGRAQPPWLTRGVHIQCPLDPSQAQDDPYGRGTFKLRHYQILRKPGNLVS
jgi:hypothetical protein